MNHHRRKNDTGTVSIAMATFNGRRYLQPQLASLAGQRRRPDELVVADDHSADETVALLESFRATAPFPVFIQTHGTRAGYGRNFMRAIAACRGDFVFLCDQDDVWFPDKIERMVALMQQHESQLALIHDAEYIDRQGRRTGLTKASQIRGIGYTADSFIQGSCTAIRKALLPLLPPLPDGFEAHDAWIHGLAGALKARLAVPDVLQYYRIHESNTSGALPNTIRVFSGRHRLGQTLRYMVRQFGDRSLKMEELHHRLTATQALSRRLRSPASTRSDGKIGARLPEALANLDGRETALRNRMCLLRKPFPARTAAAFRSLRRGEYEHFAGWKTMAFDLAAPRVRTRRRSGTETTE